MISLLGTKRDLGLLAQKCWDVVYEGAKGGGVERERESRLMERDPPAQERSHQMESWAPQVSMCSSVTRGGTRSVPLSALCPPVEIQGFPSVR